MVTSSHEAAHRIFQDRPELLTPVSEDVGLPLTAKYLVELVEIGLGDTPARETWRNLMVGTYFPGRGTLIETTFLEGKEEGREEGRIEERSRAILSILEMRRIPTLASHRDRIRDCDDLDVLERWMKHAITVTDAEDLFAEDDDD
ncbi:hypothetical protein ACWEFL_13040 [Streptomyces sp. NPDC004838]